MEAIPARLTQKLIQEMDLLIKEGWYANRSEMIRERIKRMKAERLEAAIKADVHWGLYGKD